MALQDHAQGVANQQHIDTRLAGRMGEGGVIAGQHGDLFTVLLEALQGGQGNVRHFKGPRSGSVYRFCLAAIRPAIGIKSAPVRWATGRL